MDSCEWKAGWRWRATVMITFLFSASSVSTDSSEMNGAGAAAQEVHCFCNVMRCVSTGYMCKSALGACFADLSGLHGCLELIDRSRREGCGASSSAPLLLCCRRDMCNHPDGLDFRLYSNLTLTGAAPSTSSEWSPSGSPHNVSGEVWLKAATIAVPVCGAVVLFALVAAAMRILRRDARELAAFAALAGGPGCKQPPPPPLPPRRSRPYGPAEHPLLPPRPDKNEYNARRNRAAAATAVAGVHHTASNLYRDQGEKLYDKAAIISWGGTSGKCGCPV